MWGANRQKAPLFREWRLFLCREDGVKTFTKELLLYSGKTLFLSVMISVIFV